MRTKQPFKVRLKDINPQSLAKRIQEKLHAGYSLHTNITPVKGERKEYSWQDSYGHSRSYSEGNQIYTTYYAVVVKEQDSRHIMCRS